MLKTLHIGNFKAFGEIQHIPIRPITLIYGANSSGKSSILHSLLLANHALFTSDPFPLDVHHPRLSDSVDLGGFSQYLHQHNPQNHVTFGADIDISDLLPPTRNFFSPAKQVSIFYNIVGPTRSVGWTSNSYSLDEPSIGSFMLSLDNDLFLTSHGPDITINTAHPFCLTIVDDILEEADLPGGLTPRDISLAKRLFEQRLRSYSLKFKAFHPHVDSSRAGSKAPELSRVDILNAVASADREGILAAAIASYLPTFLAGLAEHIAVVGEDTLGDLHYLGPLRRYPPRRLIIETSGPAAAWANLDAWEQLATDDSIRDQVNQWLSAVDRLQTPYEFVVREWLETKSLYEQLDKYWQETVQFFTARIAEGEIDTPITFFDLYKRKWQEEQDSLRSEAANLQLQIDELQAEGPQGSKGNDEVEPGDARDSLAELEESLHQTNYSLDLIEEVLKSYRTQSELDIHYEIVSELPVSHLYDLRLIDKRRGIEVSHQDIGVGMSQVIPVLVESLTADGELVAIEQPELHLHPALQAELGDLFLKAALRTQVQDTSDERLPAKFLLETHSEHIILRIMRRMRDTANGTLPEGMPPVTPDDVAVLFVQPKEDVSGSVVRQLELDENGDLLDPWPGGFFEEGFRERFS